MKLTLLSLKTFNFVLLPFLMSKFPFFGGSKGIMDGRIFSSRIAFPGKIISSSVRFFWGGDTITGLQNPQTWGPLCKAGVCVFGGAEPLRWISRSADAVAMLCLGLRLRLGEIWDGGPHSLGGLCGSAGCLQPAGAWMRHSATLKKICANCHRWEKEPIFKLEAVLLTCYRLTCFYWLPPPVAR